MFYVVIGPPAAGKTTWCNEHAQPGDIVIDYDRIAQALAVDTGIADQHKHEPAVAQVARAARTAAIAKARTLADEVDVYLIHATPSAKLLAEYRAQGAEIVTIDPGESVVMERCKRLRPWQMKAAVQRWYAGKPNVQAPRPISVPALAAARHVSITSFGFDKTPPPAATFTLDCRGLPNPYVVPHLRPRSGLDRHVADWVLGHDETTAALVRARARIDAAPPGTPVTVAVGCSAGRHRAVAVAEALAADLTEDGHMVTVRHTGVRAKSAAKRKRTTTEQGLGWRHQQQRQYLLDIHIDETRCWWCARPMYVDKTKNFDGQSLSADHSLARHYGGVDQLADRLLHGQCNSERQEGDRDDTRPALSAQQGTAEPGGAPTLRLRWPGASGAR